MSMTKADAETFRSRWNQVNQAEIKELRTVSFAIKFRQLLSLTASIKSFGWSAAQGEAMDAQDAEDTEIRRRWQQLRRVLGG